MDGHEKFEKNVLELGGSCTEETLALVVKVLGLPKEQKEDDKNWNTDISEQLAAFMVKPDKHNNAVSLLDACVNTPRIMWSNYGIYYDRLRSQFRIPVMCYRLQELLQNPEPGSTPILNIKDKLAYVCPNLSIKKGILTRKEHDHNNTRSGETKTARVAIGYKPQKMYILPFYNRYKKRSTN